MSTQSPFVKAIQRIADLAGDLLVGRRALRFGANLTVTDVPAGTVGSGNETIRGYTLIEATGVLSTITGAGLIRITGTATDPVVEIGGGQAESGSGSAGAIYAESAAAGSNGDGGDLDLGGGTADGSGTAGATNVYANDARVLRASVLSGVPTATIGDEANDLTPSVNLCGPTDTVVGLDGGADPLPEPAGYYTVKINGADALIAYFLPAGA